MGNAVKQTLEGGSLRFQFNWVNNSGGYGFKDFYFWFWVKNAGLPFILVVCACLCARRRGYLDIVLGMTAIYVVAETILFQPNEYDNNKLFYIWFMFAMILAADYGSLIMQRLAGLPGRALLCGLFLWASVFSGALSLGREAVSGYQLFSANAVAAGDWIHENTDRDDVFLTGQQHINPVCSLAGAADYLRKRPVCVLSRAGLCPAVGGLQAILRKSAGKCRRADEVRRALHLCERLRTRGI